MISTTTFKSDKASRYLQQLCKHFGHKVDVVFGQRQGRVTLPMGICDLEAADDNLVMRVSAENAEDLARLEQVVGSHLERFAFRDDPKLTWTRETSLADE
jgi:hypothetical protein